MSDEKESILSRLYAWLRLKIACRLGHHAVRRLFLDDELPNPEYCIYCGYMEEL